MALLHKLNVQGLNVRPVATSRPAMLARRSPVCKAQQESKPPVPEGMEWAKPAIEFLGSEDVKPADVTSKLTSSEVYQQYAKDFFEGPVGSKSTGWNKIPESINGRAAMLGFLFGAVGEIFGGGPILSQLAANSQLTIIVVGLITAGTIIPIVKGTEGNYLRSLYDTYALPDDLFTEKLELVHGRLAMLGLVGLITIELVKGSALL